MVGKGNNKVNDHLLQNYTPSSGLFAGFTSVVEQFDRIVLTTHQGVDPDGIGSEYALYRLFSEKGKTVYVINPDPIPEALHFMVPTEVFLDFENNEEEIRQLQLENVLLLNVDNSELKRCGKVAEFMEKFSPHYVTIDHHSVEPSENYFVDPEYSATCEMVWDLYHYYQHPFEHQIALALYTGIVADSGNFRYSKTTLRTHLAGGELLAYGIDSDDIYRHIFESAPFDRHQLFQKILQKAVFNKEKQYVAGFVFKKMMKDLELGDSPTEGIVNQLLAVRGVKIAALMTETPDGDLKCSLRSIGDINVADIAARFGGGGHRNAAGLYQKGPFKKAREQILAAIDETLS